MSVLLSKPPQDLREQFLRLKTRQDIAELLEITVKQLNFHLYVLPSDKRYTEFMVPKKMGGYRQISAPISPIKIIQRKLKQVLEAVYKPKPSTHGFTIKRSIVTNAKLHKKSRYVLNIDIEDFFPTIHFGRVRGMFMGNPYRLNDEVSTILAQICCHNRSLPQGAPTSPVISNMICARLDAKLQQLARDHLCNYSRYADDITFSTNRAKFPSALAYLSELGQLEVGKELTRVINENGFKVNSKKTRLQLRQQRQEVTGLTVNRYPNVQRRYIKRLRGILHAYKKFKVESTAQRYFENYAKYKYPDPDGYRPAFEKVVLGKIVFVGMVKGKNNPVYRKLLTDFQKLAPDFVKGKLLDSISLTEPIIYSEGPTDSDHITAALRDLQEREFFLNLRLSFSKNKFTGNDDLLQLLKVEARKEEHHDRPMIFIFDRDVSHIMREIDGTEDYKDWGHGIYSLAIPIPKHREDTPNISIELCYRDEDIMRKDPSGKRLFLNNEFNSSGKHLVENLEYGGNTRKLMGELKVIDDKVFDSERKNVALSKSKFSRNILKRVSGFDNADFSGFKPLFERIKMIISDFDSGEI